jgi:hypothetical protein
MDERPNRPSVVPHGTVLPPPAPGVRHVPVVFVGVVISDDDLRRRVDRYFHWPMMVLALCVIPLLVIELMQKAQGWLGLAVKIGFGVIWLAFLVEFVVKVALAESRTEYARRNWLDLIIIVVPVLRPLRLTGSLVRTTRVFKLRGVAMKAARYVLTIVLGLEVTAKLLHRMGIRRRRPHEKDPDEMTRHELTTEIRRLRKLTDAWEQWHDAHDAHVEEHGGACYIEPRPTPHEP